MGNKNSNNHKTYKYSFEKSKRYKRYLKQNYIKSSYFHRIPYMSFYDFIRIKEHLEKMNKNNYTRVVSYYHSMQSLTHVKKIVMEIPMSFLFEPSIDLWGINFAIIAQTITFRELQTI